VIDNSKKIILDLCGGTGSWSKPYREAGYDVRVITLPEVEVKLFQKPKEKIYGILAAPPCEHFSNSGAQYWKQKDRDGRTLQGISIMDACIRIIFACKPVFWALENPAGRMKYYLGEPVFKFNPCDFGGYIEREDKCLVKNDAYTKKTLLWGNFNIPEARPVEPIFITAKNGDRYSPIHWYSGGKSVKTKEKRAMTPQGFAKAFYQVNR
jgi:site-specific DNA-cytosine methylase